MWDGIDVLRLEDLRPGLRRYLGFTSEAGQAGVRVWLRALSGGYTLFDADDVFKKVEGPALVLDLAEAADRPRRRQRRTLLGARAAELQQVKTERSGLSREQRSLKERLDRLQAEAVPLTPSSLPQLLVERGCQDEREVVQALQGLLACRPEELVAALEELPGDPRATRVLLNDRLFLLTRWNPGRIWSGT